MRTFNLKLILWLAGIFVLTAIAVHFTHRFQVRRNAGSYLELATTQEATARDEKTPPPERAKALESAGNNYRRYLALNPIDFQARAKYGLLLLNMPLTRDDLPRAFFQFERVLRDIPTTPKNPADQASNDELDKKIRTEQVRLATALRRFDDAVAHLEVLKAKAAPAGEKSEVRLDLTEQQADCKLANLDKDGARDLLRTVVDPNTGDPKRVSAHRRLIRVLLRYDDPKEVREAVERMLAANPENPDALLTYAEFRLSDNRPDPDLTHTPEWRVAEAREKCTKALALRPDDADGLALAAQVELRDRSVITPDGRRLPDFEKANQMLRRSLELNPNVPARYEFLAQVELAAHQANNDELGGLDAALAVIQQGVETIDRLPANKTGGLNPISTLELRYRWSELLIAKEGTQTGLSDEEKAKLEALVTQLKKELGPQPTAAFLDAYRLVAKRDWQKARDALVVVRRAFETPLANNQPVPGAARLLPQVRRLLAQCYAQLGSDDLKVAAYKEIADQNRFDPDAVRTFAEALLSVGKFDEGLAEYERWRTMCDFMEDADQFKRYFQLRFNAANRLPRREDQRAGALRALQGLLAQYASRPAAKKDAWPLLTTIDLAMALERAERPAEAPAPDTPLGVSTQTMDEAKRLLAEARDDGELKTSLPIWITSIELAQRRKDVDEAASLWQKVESDFGDTFDVRMAKARYLLNEKGAAALPELAALTENLPADVDDAKRASMYVYLGRLCLTVDQGAEALKYILKAVELAPGQLPIRIMALQTAQQAGDVETVNRLADEIQSISPGSDDAHYTRAVAYLTKYLATAQDQRDKGVLEDAKKELLAAQEVRKEWALPYVLLGMIEGELGNTEGMAERYQEAIKRGASDPRLVVTAVNWLTRRGRVTEADELIQKIEAAGGGETSKVAEAASNVAAELEDYDRAIEKRFLAISGGMTDAQQFLALAYLFRAQGDWGKADENLQKAIAADAAEGVEGTGLPYVVKVQMLMTRAGQMRDEKDAKDFIAQAASTVEEAKKQANISPSLRTQTLAQCEDLLGNTNAAAQMFITAVGESPDDVALQEAAARFFARHPALRGRAQAILTRFLSGELKRKDGAEADLLVWARREMAAILADSGTYAGFQEALKLSNENMKVLEPEAGVTDTAKDLDRLAEMETQAKILASRELKTCQEQALGLLERRAEQEPPPSLEIQFLRAQLLLALGRWPEANKLMANVVAVAQQSADRTRDPSSEAHANLARFVNAYIGALLAHGEVNEAQGWIAVWRRSDPGAFGATLAEARALVPRPQPKAAGKDGDGEKKKGETEHQLRVAEALASLEMAVSEAGLSNDEIQRRTLLSVLVMEDLLKIVIDCGTPPDADLLKTRIREYYQRLLAADPKQAPKRQLMQVRFLVLAGERQQAVDLLKQHWSEAGSDTLVIACAALLNFSDEMKQLEQTGAEGKLTAEEVDRKKKELLASVGEAELIAQQALVKAQQELAASSTDVEKSSKAGEVTTYLSLLGGHYLASKRYDEAMQAYTQILNLNPGHIVALNNRAMIMAGTKTNLPEALTQVDSAIQMVGPLPLIVDSKAMVLYAAGQYIEALAAAQQVIAEVPDHLDPVKSPGLAKTWGGYYFHLAVMFDANKEQASAADAMKKARELGFGEADVSDLEMGLWKEISGKISG